MSLEKEVIEKLLEWAYNYFQSRDAYHKRITHIQKEEEKLIIHYKNRRELILACPRLYEVEKFGPVSVITLNNIKNVKYLEESWDKIKQIERLKLYFINPFSATDKKWVINPNLHAKVCDESSLKTGLFSMFETVEPITEKMINNNIFRKV